jgi:hypothetical protein
MITYVKQYGCKRSGTCYVAALLRKNFPNTHVLIHRLGGKHADPVAFAECEATEPDLQAAIAAEQVRSVIAVKNPYSWIHSYVSTHKNQKWSPDFSARYAKDPIEATKWACQMWNQRNRLWAEMPKWRLFVRHEDLLTHFQQTMRRVETQLDLPIVPGAYQNIEKKMTPNDTESKKTFDAKPYLLREYLEKLGPATCQLIESCIDWDLAYALGYTPAVTHEPKSAGLDTLVSQVAPLAHFATPLVYGVRPRSELLCPSVGVVPMIVELGAHAGELTKMLSFQTSKLLAVDAWNDSGHCPPWIVEQNFDSHAGYLYNVMKIRGTGQTIVTGIPDGSVNMLFIGANFSASAIRELITIWSAKLADNGCIAIFDPHEQLRGYLPTTQRDGPCSIWRPNVS